MIGLRPRFPSFIWWMSGYLGIGSDPRLLGSSEWVCFAIGKGAAVVGRLVVQSAAALLGPL
ncbi:MAG TPA: hypothetical protein ACQGQH_07080 [Xylella sp.]